MALPPLLVFCQANADCVLGKLEDFEVVLRIHPHSQPPRCHWLGRNHTLYSELSVLAEHPFPPWLFVQYLSDLQNRKEGGSTDVNRLEALYNLCHVMRLILYLFLSLFNFQISSGNMYVLSWFTR